MIVTTGVDVAKARAWIEADLQVCSGWGRLARFLSPRIAPAPRSVFAVVAEWIDIASLESYEHSPHPPGSITPFHEELARFVRAYLEVDERACVLCQAGSPIQSLRNWSFGPPQHFFDGAEEVYFFLTSKDRNLGAIEAIFGNAVAGRDFSAAICARLLPEVGRSTDEAVKEPTASILEEAAGRAEYLIVGAFGGSGYLVWEF